MKAIHVHAPSTTRGKEGWMEEEVKCSKECIKGTQKEQPITISINLKKIEVQYSTGGNKCTDTIQVRNL